LDSSTGPIANLVSELTTIPEGAKELFNTILALYDAAPATLDPWEFFIFRPRESHLSLGDIFSPDATGNIKPFLEKNVRYLLTNIGRECHGLLKLTIFMKNFVKNDFSSAKGFYALI